MWGRAFIGTGHVSDSVERARVRARCIYVLLFRNGAVYVGQSVDPRRRRREHIRQSGWRQPFHFQIVDCITGTFAQAEDGERAWRLIARRHNHPVYGMPPAVVVNPHTRATPLARLWSGQKSWPWSLRVRSALARNGWGWVRSWDVPTTMGWWRRVLYAARTVAVGALSLVGALCGLWITAVVINVWHHAH